MNLHRCIAVGLMLSSLLISTTAVSAQTFPVDDSASQVLDSGTVRMRWDAPVPRPGQSSTISGQVTVLVRLDVSPWLGRNARIYQKLPSLASGPVTARWTTQGALLPGALHAGERTLVYAGAISSARIEDTFHMTIQADGDRVLRQESLPFSFEIELETAQ